MKDWRYILHWTPVSCLLRYLSLKKLAFLKFNLTVLWKFPVQDNSSEEIYDHKNSYPMKYKEDISYITSHLKTFQCYKTRDGVHPWLQQMHYDTTSRLLNSILLLQSCMKEQFIPFPQEKNKLMSWYSLHYFINSHQYK